MIKKLGNKGLLLILVALLAIFGIFRYISNRNGENTFKTALIPKIDSTKLNGIVIFQRATKKGTPKPFIFTLKGKVWYVSQGDVTGLADSRAAQYMVSQLQQISPDRLGSNDPKDWKQFDVNDSLGTRVALLYDKDTALNVIVGRFSYIPSQKKGMSYVRLAGQNEVYAVDGFLSMNVSNEFDNWRNKKVMPGDYPQWTKLTYTYPNDSGFTIQKDSNGQWLFSDGKMPDSLAAVNLIRDASSQNYGSFINKFDSTHKQPLFTLRAEGDGFSPAIIKAYPTDTVNKYVISSTINPGSFFDGSKNNMFSKAFPSKKAFFRKDFKSLPKPVMSTVASKKR
jgi:Domain of unknown function (DUF4340)